MKSSLSTGQRVRLQDDVLNEEEMDYYGLSANSVGTIIRTAGEKISPEERRKSETGEFVLAEFTSTQIKHGWRYAVLFDETHQLVFFREGEISAVGG